MANAVVAAARGRTDLAIALGEESVQLAESTDWLDLRASTLETLVAVGGPISLLDRALDLYEQRGNVVGVARVSQAR